MTTPRTKAVLYHEIAELYAELAILEAAGNGAALETPPQRLNPLPAQAPRPQVHTPPPPAPGPSPVLDVDITTHCPKHGSEYRRGNYGPYCPARTDDPAFADRKGYCNLPGEDGSRARNWVAIQRGAGA